MKRKCTKRKFLAGVMFALLLCLLVGCGSKKRDSITSLSQLGEPGRRIGVSLSCPEEATLPVDYPDAEITVYTDVQLGCQDVANGKIDAYFETRTFLDNVVAGGTKGVRVLEETYRMNPVGIGISKVSDIPDLENQLNNFIAEIKADGTLDDIYDRWVDQGVETMPDIAPAEDAKYHLRVGTTGMQMPYSYYVGDTLAGSDIELAHRFAAWLGADLEIRTYDFNGIIAAAQAGDVDLIMSNLYITPERAEAVLFSDTLHEVEVAALVRSGEASAVQEASKVRPQDDNDKVSVTDNTLDDFSNKKIGVLQGSFYDAIASERIPGIELSYYNTTADMLIALKTGKVDAFVGAEPVLRVLMRNEPALSYLPEYMLESPVAFAFPKTDKGRTLNEQFSEYIRQLKEEGVLEEIDGTWFGADESRKVTTELSELPAVNGTLVMATTGTFEPLTYIKDGKVTGFDIDLATRFCKEYGYGLDIQTMDLDGLLSSLQSGKCDFGGAGLAITEERKEKVDFSESYFSSRTVLAVWEDAAEEMSDPSFGQEDAVPEFQSFEELNGKTISMLTGAPFEELISSKVPNVKEFTYFQTMPDMMLAVQSKKSDAGFMNNAVAELAANREKDLTLFPEPLGETTFGIAFAKGDDRYAAWQEAYETISDETQQALWKKWTGADESVKTLPAQDWPGEGGSVTVAACDTLEPMSYAGEGGEIIGFDEEMILLMAKELDVHVNFTGMEFAAVLSAVQSGKADLGCGSIVVTDERKEAVDFVEYYPASYVLIVRSIEKPQGGGAFFTSVKESFEKTFVRESRWKLFVQGIGTTLLITVLSVLLGTLLGFGAFMACRNGNPVANKITKTAVWLVQGMPMVVLLMILYYIIFGKVDISGTLVAIIGFTLVFGAAVYGMMKAGVGAVDGGQMEAALALGYENRRAFYRVVLPQALPHIRPMYLGEITGLIKATAIVGYIAVQDLTRMGDLVRSRTYDAFFPLIAVAIVYFALEGILIFVVSRIEINVNPKRRKREDILKGVQTND